MNAPLPTETESADRWRAGCECARAGLCYRCQAATEIERLQREVKQAEHRAFQGGRISYMGFNYGIGSQAGIDSLRNAINRNGHG